MNVREPRFPLFDSLRAIAALSVFATHAFFVFDQNPAAPLRPYFIRLDVGVSIFFAISGFLLYRPFVRARLAESTPPRVSAYLWRRVLRIGPPYWVALTVVALWLGLPNVLNLSYGPLFFGFSQIYYGKIAVGGLAQAWSLGVEASFYLFLPLYALFMSRLPITGKRGRLRAELAGVAVLYVTSTAFNFLPNALHTTTNFHHPALHLMLPGYLNDFSLGMLWAVLSVWYTGRELPRWLRPVDRFPVLPWIVAAAAFVAVSKGIGLNGAFGEHVSMGQYVARYALYSVVGGAIITPAVFGDQTRGLVRRLLAQPALLLLGLVSYSFFLYHVAVLDQLERWHVTPVLGVLLGLAGSVGVAVLSYRLAERPFLRLKHLVQAAGRPSAAEGIGEPAPAVAADVAPGS